MTATTWTWTWLPVAEDQMKLSGLTKAQVQAVVMGARMLRNVAYGIIDGRMVSVDFVNVQKAKEIVIRAVEVEPLDIGEDKQ